MTADADREERFESGAEGQRLRHDHGGRRQPQEPQDRNGDGEDEAEAAVRDVQGVRNVSVELVWEPYWTPERVDPKLRAYLGF